MIQRYSKLYFLIFVLLYGSAILANRGIAQQNSETWQRNIPKTWVDAEIAELEVPLADPTGSPKHVSAQYYYRIPERPIYKSYPVYAPDKEPAGYLDGLRQQEPEVVFRAAKLHTKQDWIRAGEMVFDAPTTFFPLGVLFTVHDAAWLSLVDIPPSKDGTIPFLRYVVRDKGRVELGAFSCGMCHTRVMPEGRLIKGAQGNFPFDRIAGAALRTMPDELVRHMQAGLFAAPWLKADDPQARIDRMTAAEIGAAHMEIPKGVVARHRTSLSAPVQIPDLIGVKDRKYLDRTGLQIHRSIADLMRYGALNQGGDDLASYAGFIPGATDFRALPDPSTQTRYGDEQLYALALFLYSLEPPPNPNKLDALAKRGQKVFQSEGCAGCHTPPLYTNNKLTPADGFTVPAEHKQKYDILPMSVATDTNLAMKTRRGTGYYKVPSLKGVWYRGPFEHSGSVATLEDWFDPKRLRDDYVPTGFKGYGVKTRTVKGHEFGLTLSVDDKRALIAFLKTL